MDRRDAVELAGTTKTVGYHEWVDIPNGLVYQSCCDCGLSHAIMVALPDPDAIPAETLRVRFLPESELTQAAREQDRLEIPLYREVVKMREENIQLKRRLVAGLCADFRRKQGGNSFTANHMHAGWDVVFDAEAILRGEPSLVKWTLDQLIDKLTKYQEQANGNRPAGDKASD